MERLPSFKTCYFCGNDNPRGFGIAYFYDPDRDRVAGEVTPDAAFCGYPGILHGGIQSALLDDVMYWAVSYRAATSSVTLELTTRFLQAARLGERFALYAQVEAVDGRKVRAAGVLQNASGDPVARGVGLYLLHPREVFLRDMLPYFDFEGCSEVVCARYRQGNASP
ncbi:MAG: PaaI family thioesterase [Deferrisomatales bacterium]